MQTEEEIKEGRKAVNISDVVRTTLKHWPWIVISTVVFTGLALIFALTRQPVYERSSKVVFKDNSSTGKLGSQLSAFAGMGMAMLGGSSQNIRDEINKLESPDVMEEVVRQLHLDMNYTIPGSLHKNVVYGDSLPVVVTIPQLSDADGLEFTLNIAPNGDISIDDIIRYTDRDPKPQAIEYDQKTPFHFDAVAKTPFGDLLVQKGPNYVAGKDYEIAVSRMPILSATKTFVDKLDVKLLDQWGNTIELTVNDNSLDRADDVLTKVVDVYNHVVIERQNATAQATNDFITERLAALEKELGGVEQSIADYKSSHAVPDVRQAAVLYMQEKGKAEEEILEIHNRLAITNYMLQYLEDPKHAGQVLPANSGIDNAGIEKQIAEYNTKVLERNRYAANSSTSHPLITTMDDEIKSTHQSIISALNNEAGALNAQLRNLESTKGQVQSKISGTPSQAIHLLGAERSQKVTESLYIYLLQKRAENELGMFSPYNTEVIDKPHGEFRPASPKKKLIVGFGFLFGFFLPFGVTFIKEVTNNSVRGVKDLARLDIPVTGEIPLWKSGKGKRHNLIEGDPIVVSRDSRNAINNAFNMVRTNLSFHSSEESRNKRGEVILLTSLEEGSGKTFVTLNLGVVMAVRDAKVIVLDCDMRKGTASSAVSNSEKGIADYLAGNTDDWHKSVVSSGLGNRTDFMAIGHLPSDPAEHLESDRFRNLIEELRESYDYILIDSPACASIPDARLIDNSSDQTIFVVRAGQFKLENIDILNKLHSDGTYREMSVIVNGVEMHDQSKA